MKNVLNNAFIKSDFLILYYFLLFAKMLFFFRRCILKEQLMSPFRGIRSGGGANHVGLYAYFKAFRFTSSPALYLECDVHMCHGTCPVMN